MITEKGLYDESTNGDAYYYYKKATDLYQDSQGKINVDGSLDVGDDEYDNYKFIATASGVANFTLKGREDWYKVALLNDNGQQVALSNYSQESGRDELSVSNLIEGKVYYLKVYYTSYASSDYTLNIQLPTRDSPSDKDWIGLSVIDDAGNSLDSATLVPLTNTHSEKYIDGHLGQSDQSDYYQIVASTNGEAKISLSNLTENSQVSLLNSNGQVIEILNVSGSADGQISQDLHEGDTYYLHVESLSDKEVNYTLGVDLQDVVIPKHHDDYVGNSLEAALLVELDSVGNYTAVEDVGIGHDINDIYTFVATKTGHVTLTLSGITDAVNLRFYDGEKNIIDELEGHNHDSKVIISDVVEGRQYYVQVDPADGVESNYRIHIDQDEPGINLDDDRVNGVSVGDAGGGLSAAEVILTEGEETVIKGNTMGSDSGDSYYFVAAEDNAIDIVINHHYKSAMGTLYDEDYTKLRDAEGDWGSGVSTLSYELVKGRGYYLSLGDNSGYTATVNLGPPAPDEMVGDTYIGDAGESYDTAAEVVLVSNSTLNISGSVGYADDRYDYFTFTAAETAMAHFNLTNLIGNLDIRLLNEKGWAVKGSGSTDTADENLTYELIGGKQYSLGVVSLGRRDTTESTYDLNISLGEYSVSPLVDTVDGQLVGDAANSLKQATAIELAESGSIAISGDAGYGVDSVDYYGFTAQASGTLNIAMTGLSSDLNIELLDATGSSIAVSSQQDSVDESIGYDLIKDHEYYLKVLPVGYSESLYTLDLNFESPELWPQTDTVEGVLIGDAGDLPENAVDIVFDSVGHAAITGEVGYATDTADYYGFTASVTGTARLELTGFTDDIDLLVMDNGVNTVAWGQSATSQYMDYDIIEGEHYFVWVDDWNDTESAYSLNIQQQAVLQGDDNANTLTGGKGSDHFYAGEGNDILIGGAGPDTYYYSRGDGLDTITDSSGIDTIYFDGGINRGEVKVSGVGRDLLLQVGSNENDQIRITGALEHQYAQIEMFKFGNDTYQFSGMLPDKFIQNGTEGGDYLHAAVGHSNEFRGYDGNDWLYGSSEADTYFFRRGDGKDFIESEASSQSSNAIDNISFAWGITKNDIHLEQGGGNLYVHVYKNGTATGDYLRIANSLDDGNYLIENLDFEQGSGADMFRGETISLADLYEAQLGSNQGDEVHHFGTSGVDYITGVVGHDNVFEGGKGADWLYGSAAADSYIFNRGDGKDYLESEVGSGISDSVDRIVFGEGINQSDIVLTQGAGNLYVYVYENGIQNGDCLRITNALSDENYLIEELEFADGSTVKLADVLDAQQSAMPDTPIQHAGTDGSDYLYSIAGRDNVFEGGKGTDRFYGSAAADTYIFNRGDGKDYLENEVSSDNSGNVDRITFGDGISQSDIVLTQGGGNLYVYVYENGVQAEDCLRIANALNDENYLIEELEFSDGSTIKLADFIESQQAAAPDTPIQHAGTDGSDYLYSIVGQDNVFEGGKGTDRFYGSAEADTYIFNRGDGKDYLENEVSSDSSDSIDRIVFGDGISQSDIVLTQGAGNLYVYVYENDVQNDDCLRVANAVADENYLIEVLEFADGQTITMVDLIANSEGFIV